MISDGSAIVWSSGPPGSNVAPQIWRYDIESDTLDEIYSSENAHAIISNLAAVDGAYAFAEVLPTDSGRNTWRLIFMDMSRQRIILDENDMPADLSGMLPMVSIGDTQVVWATTHANGSSVPQCQLLSASRDGFAQAVLRDSPCNEAEYWYPASDGEQFVYGTVDYRPDAGGDERQVLRFDSASPARHIRLDTDGDASLPAILGETVVWKTAPRSFNMLNWGNLVEYDLSDGSEAELPYLHDREGLLNSPSLGPAFVAAENFDPTRLVVFDRVRKEEVEVDALATDDSGFLSNVHLSGNLLVWVYTPSAQGGDRELRWALLDQP